MTVRMSIRTIAIIIVFGALMGGLALVIGWWATPIGVVLGVPVGLLLAKWDTWDDDRRFRREQETFRWWDA